MAGSYSINLLGSFLALSLLLLLYQAPDVSARRKLGKQPVRDDDDDSRFWVAKNPCGIGPPFRQHPPREPILDETDRKLKRNVLRIAGGYPANDGEFPSFVAIGICFADRNCYQASGVLLDDDVVLTAAHTLYLPRGLTITSIHVAPGIIPTWRWNFTTKEPPLYKVDFACHSPRFNNIQNPPYDYAFLKLRRRIPLTPEVQTACLPDNEPDIDAPCRVVGQGVFFINSEEPDDADYAHVAQVLPVKQHQCLPRDEHPTKICFKDYLKDYQGDTCKGDSGGPVYLDTEKRHTVLALTSYGQKFCDTDRPGVSVNADLIRLRSKIHVLRSMKRCFDERENVVFDSRDV